MAYPTEILHQIRYQFIIPYKMLEVLPLSNSKKNINKPYGYQLKNSTNAYQTPDHHLGNTKTHVFYHRWTISAFITVHLMAHPQEDSR